MGHGHVVGIEALRRGLVVIGADHQQTVHAHLLGRFTEFQSVLRGIGAGAGDDFTAPFGIFLRPGEQFQFFLIGQCG